LEQKDEKWEDSEERETQAMSGSSGSPYGTMGPNRLDKIEGDEMLVSISDRVLKAEIIDALEVHCVRNGAPKFFVYSRYIVA